MCLLLFGSINPLHGIVQFLPDYCVSLLCVSLMDRIEYQTNYSQRRTDETLGINATQLPANKQDSGGVPQRQLFNGVTRRTKVLAKNVICRPWLVVRYVSSIS